MSNLDVYYILHFKDKCVFAHMDELGLTLDRKDFATKRYALDEDRHPKSASKAVGRKKKAVVRAS